MHHLGTILTLLASSPGGMLLLCLRSSMRCCLASKRVAMTQHCNLDVLSVGQSLGCYHARNSFKTFPPSRRTNGGRCAEPQVDIAVAKVSEHLIREQHVTKLGLAQIVACCEL
jgi:hypothetical protein